MIQEPLINNKNIINEKIKDLFKMNYDVPNLKYNKELTGWEIFLLYFVNITIYICTLPLFCIGLWMSFVNVNSLEGVIICYFGKINRMIKEPGLYFILRCFSEIKRINLSLDTMEIIGSHVPDTQGSLLSISAVVTYKVNDSISALYNVENYKTFIHSQSLDVIRKVISRFAYRSENDKEPTILNDSFLIGMCMKELLQKKINVAGIEVIRMD